MSRSHLCVCFAGIDEYPLLNLTKHILPTDTVYLVSPFYYIHHALNPFRRLTNTIRTIFNKQKPVFYPCITPSELQIHLSDLGCVTEELVLPDPSPLELIKESISSISSLFQLYSSLYSKPRPVPIASVESSAYLIDSLQKWCPRFSIASPFALQSLTSCYLYILRTRLFSISFTKAVFRLPKLTYSISNHSVYYESGWPCEYISLINPHTKNLFLSSLLDKPFFSAIRADFTKIVPYATLPLVNPSTSYKRPSWFDNSSLSDLPDLRQKTYDPTTVCICMHALTDANHIFYTPGQLFSSYFSWISYTLKIARQNPHITTNFRLHPSTLRYYEHDLHVFKTLFRDLPSHIVLSEPHKSSPLHTTTYPLFVTYSGSIALELACSGVKAITISEPFAPSESYIKTESLTHYASILCSPPSFNDITLSDSQVTVAHQYKLAFAQTFS